MIDKRVFLRFTIFMGTLVIEINAKSAALNALIGFIVTAIVCVVSALLLKPYLEVEHVYGSQMVGVTAIFLGLICSSAVYHSIWLFKLGRFLGPLITLSPDGVIDHFNSEKHLSWEEVEFIGWKDFKNDGIVTPLFKIIPKNRSLKYKILSTLGAYQLVYPQKHLLTPEKVIAEYISKEVPAGILKQ